MSGRGWVVRCKKKKNVGLWGDCARSGRLGGFYLSILIDVYLLGPVLTLFSYFVFSIIVFFFFFFQVISSIFVCMP